ncbi:hypothetical protein KC19_6G019100 [Ceratodon purpureus]|uniref:Ubiquinol oxidase n=1 Tax=Ceratodon purpureus TaxID=3225 RepID=A0A8T0HE66_CERPU|nr:hypothetical protein KC19_6G019100 [Ceratodon purpureus]
MTSSPAIGLLRSDGLVFRAPEVSRSRLECGRELGRALQVVRSRSACHVSNQVRCSLASSVPRCCSRRGRRVVPGALAEERAVEAEEGSEEAGVSDAAERAAGLEKWVIKGERAFNQLATDAVIQVLDVFYKDRDYARFYVLETIARVPYFAFVSVLHMYESFGWWRRADYIKVHFAESWNELHHLLTMEALGGDERWADRFLAQHIAVGYYFLTVVMYLLSPRMAYHFSECVEKHAFHTYDEFIKLHGEELKKLPAPEVAVRYYTEGDLYMFDEFQTGRSPNTRRPKVENLYDVFYNIREDEAEHCKTMLACQTRGNLRSPHSAMHAPAASPASVPSIVEEEAKLLEIIKDLPPAECAGIIECALTSSSFVDRARKNGIEVNPDRLPR